MLATIGWWTLVFFIIKLCYHLYRWYRATSVPFYWRPLTRDGDGGEPRWAVITGATDGIGYEFARQLAWKGFHLMLISRNVDRLEQCKRLIFDELQQQQQRSSLSQPIQIRTLAVDFTNTDIYDRIEKFLSPNENRFGILVNNVGVATKLPGLFLGQHPATSLSTDESVQEQRQLTMSQINVNVIGTTKMLELILPRMIEQHERDDDHDCLVLNVSSLSDQIIAPLISMYSSTKAYITHLSECLSLEYPSVTFITLIPGFVDTKLLSPNRIPFKRLLLPSAETYVRSVLKHIRYRRSMTRTGYAFHRTLWEVAQIVNWWLSKEVVGAIAYWFYGTVRKQALVIEAEEEVKRSKGQS